MPNARDEPSGAGAVCAQPRVPLSDKTALAEIGTFERAPRDFEPRVNELFACLGASVAELDAAVERVGRLLHETTELASGLYEPRFVLPKPQP